MTALLQPEYWIVRIDRKTGRIERFSTSFEDRGQAEELLRSYMTRAAGNAHRDYDMAVAQGYNGDLQSIVTIEGSILSVPGDDPDEGLE